MTGWSWTCRSPCRGKPGEPGPLGHGEAGPLADGVGFEPTRGVNLCRFSRQVRSVRSDQLFPRARPVVSGLASGLSRPDRTKEPNSSKGADACDGTLPRQNGIQICCTKGLPMTPREELTQANIAVLRAEADEARHLASALDDTASIVDLLKYAQALEADADLWERELRRAYQAA